MTSAGASERVGQAASERVEGAAELLAYGTAVVVRDE